MEASVNRVELLGRTGNQPTLRQTPSGTPLTQFSLYTHQIWRNAADQLCEATERHTVTAWGQLAIQCVNHLHKGSRVYVTGRLQTHRWEDPDTGEQRQRTEVVAAEVIFLNGIQQSKLPPDYGLPEPDIADDAVAADEVSQPNDA
jgi:single-strand DNA-binding protein